MPADRTLDLLPAETAEVPVVARGTPHQQLPERSADILASRPRRRRGRLFGGSCAGQCLRYCRSH
jgi:hypothetical protein